ncbi:MAG TPA: hypothetical protein VMT36_02350 [Candidatus Saccharimonadia bacterium]|nr:hypothetical protein [Candidatus Saccharimonadia bacterium]
MDGSVPVTWRTRDTIALVIAALGGLAIAWIDASPGWDDTGITVGLLVIAAAAAAGLSGRRPWLWALVVGLPTPFVEMSRGGDPAVFAALFFAAIGAAVGYSVGRLIGRGQTVG